MTPTIDAARASRILRTSHIRNFLDGALVTGGSWLDLAFERAVESESEARMNEAIGKYVAVGSGCFPVTEVE